MAAVLMLFKVSLSFQMLPEQNHAVSLSSASLTEIVHPASLSFKLYALNLQTQTFNLSKPYTPNLKPYTLNLKP